ncbi:Putative transcription factor bHLH041 [Apostasia shenzhenica]|uniref:Transcription factor bHLH041 n=1 Tax=Apostasia shenzhenica TaxID=1088818 RepID=A0A2I0AP75_9ASPA|nr:Putative transcription factor bHLH041 [Apostasia shenzhenica]
MCYLRLFILIFLYKQNVPFARDWSSFSSFDDSFAGISPEEAMDLIGFGDSELLNPSSCRLQRQIDDLNMLMESMEQCASLQIPQLSIEKTRSTDSIPSGFTMNPKSSTGLRNRGSDVVFKASARDEMAITRAMLSVISSSSSSSSSSPSYLHCSRLRSQNTVKSAFQPYNSSLSPLIETRQAEQNQNMIKRAHMMLRKVKRQEETEARIYQKKHTVSERQRRERLNAGFHSLWQLLPPGSKKDKTSVLCKTMSYLNELKAEVHELEEKNRVMEDRLLPTINGPKEERIEVRIIKPLKPESEEQNQIELVIMVRVKCNLIKVALHVLEFIKEMKCFSLISMDAFPQSEGLNLSATLRLETKDSNWDEETFKEGASGAAYMALMAPS